MTELNVAICIDDVNPKKGWAIQSERTEEYLADINSTFGAKFNLFIPSNYHGSEPLRLNKDWVRWLTSKPYFEVSAHGHYHNCKNPMIGEQEFLELDYGSAIDRIDMMRLEWSFVGMDISQMGFRMPGWGCSQGSADAAAESFSYLAAHREINFGITLPVKTLYGSTGIHESENLGIESTNTVMFQSHICGNWNRNVWNENNYEHFRSVLSYLSSVYKLNFVNLRDII